MLYKFQKGNNPMEAKKKKKKPLCGVFGEEAVTAQICQRWFVKFHLGDFSLKDEPRSARSSDVNDEMLLSVIKTNPTLTFIKVGFELGIHHTTALDHIKKLSFVS
ncbi:histone-lysine N-methyltransferase SETMAR [Trichonephila clavipes]|nr:histone-lysine N-methyltransferase SETMAR [Trichonephila clavipes]